MLKRRHLLAAGACAPWLAAIPLRARAQAAPIYLADMHSHLYLDGLSKPISGPLLEGLRAGGATLVSWAWVADWRWLGVTNSGVVQQGVPQPGEIWAYFERGIAHMTGHLTQQNLPMVLGAADVDNALAGEPHVVLSSEGGDFLEGDLSRVAAAQRHGLRHLQLVHYIKNPIGDFQTEKPVHNGLTAFGKEVVAECNRLGILVDLAHCTEEAVEQALAISKAPMIWSHSSVGAPRGHWTMPGWRARRLSVEAARRVAAGGGVVGLWAFARDVGGSVAGYTDALLKMADAVGEDHVAFGTDMNGLGPGAMMNDYTDLRKVVETMQARGVPEVRMRKLAIGNYARVLKAAFAQVRG